MAAKNPFVFIREVRTEVAKVTWPTRRETMVSSVMVFIMVFIAGVFFFLIDKGFSFTIGSILSWEVKSFYELEFLRP